MKIGAKDYTKDEFANCNHKKMNDSLWVRCVFILFYFIVDGDDDDDEFTNKS